jgi:hypothetical protein
VILPRRGSAGLIPRFRVGRRCRIRLFRMLSRFLTLPGTGLSPGRRSALSRSRLVMLRSVLGTRVGGRRSGRSKGLRGTLTGVFAGSTSPSPFRGRAGSQPSPAGRGGPWMTPTRQRPEAISQRPEALEGPGCTRASVIEERASPSPRPSPVGRGGLQKGPACTNPVLREPQDTTFCLRPTRSVPSHY